MYVCCVQSCRTIQTVVTAYWQMLSVWRSTCRMFHHFLQMLPGCKFPLIVCVHFFLCDNQFEFKVRRLHMSSCPQEAILGPNQLPWLSDEKKPKMSFLCPLLDFTLSYFCFLSNYCCTPSSCFFFDISMLLFFLITSVWTSNWYCWFAICAEN